MAESDANMMLCNTNPRALLTHIGEELCTKHVTLALPAQSVPPKSQSYQRYMAQNGRAQRQSTKPERCRRAEGNYPRMLWEAESFNGLRWAAKSSSAFSSISLKLKLSFSSVSHLGALQTLLTLINPEHRPSCQACTCASLSCLDLSLWFGTT